VTELICRQMMPTEIPPPRSRNRSKFRAGWSDTSALLDREAGALGAARVVVQLAVVSERDLRQDGWVRSDARIQSPAVVVSLDSRYGPLRYATDEYDNWQDNVRAVALSMQALRAVDRYGVSKRGEQYRGWTALPTGSRAIMGRDEAARLLAAGAREIDGAAWNTNTVRDDPEAAKRAFRTVAKRHHPDVGGDPNTWDRIEEARRVLGLA
jgi:hypothetical protein